MENSEYIVVNKTAIQKEKEELKKLINKYIGYAEQEIYDKIDELCSQSIPFIPEIENSYRAGYCYSQYHEYNEKGEIPIQSEEEYIANLKLDI